MALHRRAFALGLGATLSATGASATEPNDMMTLGSPSARLHLVEYASATCPHCAHFHETNWATLKASYIDTGRIRFTLREMLTPPPAVALGMFQVARCNGANAEEYYRRLGVLFARQRAIVGSGSMAGVRDALFATGAEWGLSNEQVWAALTDQSGQARVVRSIEEASARGVTSTPSFYVNDQKIEDQGFLTPDGMSRILDAALAE